MSPDPTAHSTVRVDFDELSQNMAEGVAVHELVRDDAGEVVNYRILRVNKSYSRHVGLAPEHVVGRLATAAYGTSPAPYLEEFSEVALTGEAYDFETFFEPHGRLYHVHVYSPLPDHFVTVFSDVTARHEREQQVMHLQAVIEAVRRVNQLLIEGPVADDALLEQVCDALVTTQGYVTAWIGLCETPGGPLRVRAYRSLDPPPETDPLAVGTPPCAAQLLANDEVLLIPASSEMCRACGLNRVATGHDALSARLLVGGRVYGSLQVTLPFGRDPDDGERALVAEVASDLALALHKAEMQRQREEAFAQLAESQRRLETLMANLPGMVYRCRNDDDWTMLFVSPGCRELLDCPPEDLVGNRCCRFGDMLVPDERERVWTSTQRALAERRPYEYTYQLETMTGVRKWVWERGCGVFADDGQLLCLEGFITDISRLVAAEEERQSLREQLHQAQKLESIGRVTSGVAHDFNNLLGVIQGGLDLISLPGATESDREGTLEDVREAVRRATELTRQLLAFSRGQPLVRRRVDLNELVADNRRLLERILAPQQQLVIEPAAKPPLSQADPDQLGQVLLNLTVNARDAMPPDGRLVIRLGEREVQPDDRQDPEVVPGDYAVIEVEDNGCGMDAEVLEQAFEPFFTTKAPGEGTGLGLSTVFGIVRQHDGFVQVRSEPGAGTRFRLLLPRQQRPTTERLTSPPPQPSPQLPLVLVEDDPVLLSVTESLLRLHGLPVRTCRAPAEALALAAHQQFSLLICDLSLPEMSGGELAQKLRGSHRQLPVLFISGAPPTGDELQAPRTAFLRKPYTAAQLRAAIADLLGESGPAEQAN